MISYIYWNPKKEIFTIPIVNYPIVWYSVLFLIGFVFGYLIFQAVLRRYFYLFLDITEKDIISYDLLIQDLITPKNDDQKIIAKKDFKKNESKDSVLKKINAFISSSVKKRLFLENAFSESILTTKKKIILITDKLMVYMIVATVIGARLGHLIFYEKPEYYLKNPLNIFKVWQGGLASHGAAVAILIGLFLFCRELKKYSPKITYVHLLDFICPSVAFAGFCIRVGNFINQEIIGNPTKVFWAVVFGNPQDGSEIVPRHPVQLYEAFFYLSVFFLLFFLSRKTYFLIKEGKLFSIFLISVFSFRFIIEFLKVKLSYVLDESFLSMGQYLSIPFIIIGFGFMFWDKLKKLFLEKETDIH
ncbi:MAG: prolipoprotein diacylglyceryl transferase [Parachlamydiales bacterium]|jgi:prolipoprotein diacylglyceryl transferase